MDGNEKSTSQWREGFEAFEEGKTSNDNPYPYLSDEYDCWSQGWQEALSKSNDFDKGV